MACSKSTMGSWQKSIVCAALRFPHLFSQCRKMFMLTLVFCLGVSFVSALHDFPDASKKEGPSNTHTYTRTHTHTHTHTIAAQLLLLITLTIDYLIYFLQVLVSIEQTLRSDFTRSLELLHEQVRPLTCEMHFLH